MIKRKKQAMDPAGWHGQRSRDSLCAGPARERSRLALMPSCPDQGPGPLGRRVYRWGSRRRMGVPGTPRATPRLDPCPACGYRAAASGRPTVQNKANSSQGQSCKTKPVPASWGPGRHACASVGVAPGGTRLSVRLGDGHKAVNSTRQSCKTKPIVTNVCIGKEL
jgi:hypothetical protein